MQKARVTVYKEMAVTAKPFEAQLPQAEGLQGIRYIGKVRLGGASRAIVEEASTIEDLAKAVAARAGLGDRASVAEFSVTFARDAKRFRRTAVGAEARIELDVSESLLDPREIAGFFEALAVAAK